MIAFIQLIVIFALPIFILRHSQFVITKWFGTIGTAYLAGIFVALGVYLLNQLGVILTLSTDIGEIGSHLAISIAIPLLLFSANLQEAKKLSKTVLLSFGSLLLATVIVSSLVFLFYAKNIENGAELSGMAIGVYTGGTPNLNAIGKIFQVDNTTIGIANLSDMMIGAVFYVFLLVLCKPLLSKILPQDKHTTYLKETSMIENTDDLKLQHFKLSTALFRRVILAFIIAIVGALFGVFAWYLLPLNSNLIDILVPTMMITVTVLGIAGSFNKTIRETKGMNVAGQYFILVFSFALASSLDFSRMQTIFFNILILYGGITIGVFVLHTLISKLLRIGPDCTMVTLTAGLYGPAFVPAITKQIKNDDLTVPGLITGSIGYAVGTFLGTLLVLLYLG
ncbi:MAG: DUF819 family protein [Candidatus Izimaplasma sp.]|nr:DUF819 family protein [Candidatus Izimaplasma bacterium]